MVNNEYLLFIDNCPIDENLKRYFSMRQSTIVHQKSISPLSANDKVPHTVLIHWSLLKNELQLINELHSYYKTSILVIADEFEETACISALEAGADDFLAKPLRPSELFARIIAINRRVHHNQSAFEQEIIFFSNWQLLIMSRQLFKDNNQEVLLSTGEYELLFAFIQRPQQILDREFLSNLTKKNSLDPFDRRIDVQISRLRQKIELNARKPELIQTVRNKGYLFTAEVKQQKLPLC